MYASCDVFTVFRVPPTPLVGRWPSAGPRAARSGLRYGGAARVHTAWRLRLVAHADDEQA